MPNYTNLILRTLTSLYGDITRGGVLSWNDVDQNFLYLKGNLIYSSTTLGNTIYLQKYNGETISFLGGSGGTSNDTYWTSGSTGNYSLKANNDSSLDALGDYSLAEGYYTTAIGDNSHAEGGYTTAGWKGFTVYNYSGGSVNISGYGNLSGSFYTTSVLYSSTGELVPYSGTSWEPPYFKIFLTNSPSIYSAYVVADVTNLVDPLADRLLGNNNHVEGYNTKAIGSTSHGEGYNTHAIGHFSHTEGRNTSAFGETSHAEGFYSKSIGMTSHAEGRYTESFGEASHTEGRSTIAGWRGFTVSNYSAGTVTITGYGDLTNSFYPNIGSGILFDNDDFKTPYSGTAWNDPDFKINLTNSPIIYNALYVADINNLNARLADQLLGGYASHAEGVKSMAIGDGSHAEGGYYDSNTNTYYDGGQAIGISSHAEGVFTTAYGFVSHAEGSGTTAIGQFSHSSGYDTTAIGSASHSEGNETTSGWKGFTVSGITADNVIIITGYTNLTSSFNTSGTLLSQDIYGYTKTIPYTGTSWDGTDFKVYLTNTPYYTIDFVADIDFLNENLANRFGGNFSHTEGIKTTAIGRGSHAEGGFFELTTSTAYAGGTAIGDGSHAEGFTTTALGFNSHAEGGYTTSIGGSSHAEGSSTHSFGEGSHSEGYETTSNGIYSHTEGGYTISGWKGFTVSSISGNVITISGYSNTLNTSFGNTGTLYDNYDNRTIYSSKTWDSIGYVLTISIIGSFPREPQFVAPLNNLYDLLADEFGGEHSHAEGYKTSAIASTSHAEGRETTSIGGSSHAEGYQTTAYGIGSHAEGYNTTASGSWSHSEGDSTIASGNNSRASGYRTISIGNNSFVHGTGSTASASTSIVLGNNITGTTSNTVYVSNLNIKTLGGGTSVNNLGIDSNGNVVIGSSGGTSNTNITGFTYTSSTNTIYLGQTDQLEKSIYIDKMSGLTVNGNLTFTGQSNNPIYSAGTLTSTYIPNWNNSNIQTFILSATTSISGGTNIKNGAIYTIILKQDNTGTRTVNWGTPYRWQSGIAPVLTSTANAVDILTFISDGTNLYGLIAKNFI